MSYDLDLPTVTLCGLCALALLVDKETFDALTRRPPKKPRDRRRQDL